MSPIKARIRAAVSVWFSVDPRLFSILGAMTLAMALSMSTHAEEAKSKPAAAPRPLIEDIGVGLKRVGDAVGAEVQKGERNVRKRLRGEPVYASPGPEQKKSEK